MSGKRMVIVGGGVGGLAAALELARRGTQVTLLERHEQLGGKASQRSEAGFRWDEGPSIIVMPWVYRTLFEAAGLDPDHYLPFRRLEPAFRVVFSDNQTLVLPSAYEGLRAAIAEIDEADARGLDRFMDRLDRFSSMIGHAYCDRILDSWGQILASRLVTSSVVVSPVQKYSTEIDKYFRSPAIRELMYGFPTYCGFDPRTAPASLMILPWTILREGVWYPASGGIASIPAGIAAACRDLGVEIRTGVEVEAIELDATNRVRGVATSAGWFEADAVISNSDYVHTHRMLRGGKGFSNEVERVRSGRVEPSCSFFTIQLGCNRVWDRLAHHLIVLTAGSEKVYDEVYLKGDYPSDPPLYANVTSLTDPDDAPTGCSNPFIVLSVPSIDPENPPTPEYLESYADRIIDRLEAAGLPGLRESIVVRKTMTPLDFQAKFHAFRGAIYGLGSQHNILGGGFRPLNYRPDVPGLYLVGGGVQPGAGLPMAIQSGKITAERIGKDLGLRASKPRALAGSPS